MFYKVLTFLLILTLASCGGAKSEDDLGESKNTPPVTDNENPPSSNNPDTEAPLPPDNVDPALTFSPSTINTEQFENKSVTIELQATSNLSLDENDPIYIKIIDEVGVIKTDINLTFISSTTYDVELFLSDTLNPGSYNGSLEIQVCNSLSCTQQYDGSPITLNYDINILSNENLSVLSPGQFTDWLTDNANNLRNSHVDIDIDKVKNYSSRWIFDHPHLLGVGTSLNKGGLVFFHIIPDDGTSQKLYALNESDGSISWELELAPHESPMSMALENDYLYLLIEPAGESENNIWKLNALNGEIVQTGILPGDDTFLDSAVMLIEDGHIFSEDIQSNQETTLTSVDSSDMSLNWIIDPINPSAFIEQRKPLFLASNNDGNIYFYANNSIYGINKITSNTDIEITAPYTTSSDSTGMKNDIVLTDDGHAILNTTYLADSNHLYKINLSNSDVVWSIEGRFNTPVVANGKVYVNRFDTEKGLKIYDENTGELIKSIDESYYYLLATNNIIFGCDDHTTYALDSTNLEVLWSIPSKGSMSISKNKILYIRTADELRAINLIGSETP